MQSTNFETNTDLSTSKIVTNQDFSNILNFPIAEQANQLNQPSEPMQGEEKQDLNLQEQQESPPQPQVSDISSLQFSDGEQIEQEEDAKIEDQEHFSQDEYQVQNIHTALQEQQQDIADEEEEKRSKESKGKTSRLKMSLRSFQNTLLENSRDRNSIIYLPTGTGKTRISICSMYYYLCKFGTTKKIVFLANTIQLVKQQAEAIKITLQSIIENEEFARDLRQRLGNQYIQLNWKAEDLNSHVICIHGEKSEDQTLTKRKRIQSYMSSRKSFLDQMKKATVTVMISQMFLNCLRRGYIKITDYSFIVFDECHHCRGDHPYSGIMKEFYFAQKKKNKNNEKNNKQVEEKDRLPILMGLTASPVSQPYKTHGQLIKELRSLCINLDSNYAVYPFKQMITNETAIQIMEIHESQQKSLLPQLTAFFQLYKDHSTSYNKIKKHFPQYFKCVKAVIDLMSKKFECLGVQVDGSQITDSELYLFYDIKDCLLLKLRDIWLELGEFAFIMGFRKMLNQIEHLSGLRNQESGQLLKDVKQLLQFHYKELQQIYNKCQKRFMSEKVKQLIQILKPTEQDLSRNVVSDMVLVFAFKRRTVQYLQMVLEKYMDELDQDQKKFYNSVGVTGYSSRQKVYRGGDGHSYESNPSAEQSENNINKFYNNFIEKEMQFRNNQKHLEKSLLIEGSNDKLREQMARMYFSKMGKVLLQVEEKYSKQIKKILQFKKKQYRVLITTSVTEEGFDIPGCNLVISFDTPFSLKSYIQIKGRARKRNSRYIIFTNQGDPYKKMLESKKINDNTIHAMFELAINQIAKENINAVQNIGISPSYKSVLTKGGALLNTNYALQLLKSYFTSLKHPNKPYFHFIETSNICFRCVIKFPQSSPCSQSYVLGRPFSTKLEALRSAAYQAVVMLKKQNFIKDDLRPSRLEELQDQLQLQKYDDLGQYHKDGHYKQIFDRYVQIEQFQDKNSKKKLVRFYFKSLQPQKLQFPQLNRQFKMKQFENGVPHLFQVYLIKFGNTSHSGLLQQNNEVNEIGILTCFSQKQTSQMFARFKQRFQATSPETFELKLVKKDLELTISQYKDLQKVHIFLLESEKNNEVDYYRHLNNEPIVQNPNWAYREEGKKVTLKIDQTRQYYPLLLLLKNKNKDYIIDQGINKSIIDHIDLFKKLYMFHNKPTKHVYQKQFQQPLKEQNQTLEDRVLNRSGKNLMLQYISRQHCFHKGFLIAPCTKYTKAIEAQQQKKKHGKLRVKFQKGKKIFQHIQESKDIFNQYLAKIEFWKQSSKDDISMLLSKDLKLRVVEQTKGTYQFLKDFVFYPICYQTMIRISLAAKYVFQIIEDYSIALYFRKYYLKEIFDSIKKKDAQLQPYKYRYYKNIVGQNIQKISNYIKDHGKSKHLRELGQACYSTIKKHINEINHYQQNLSINFNQSSIINNVSIEDSLNQSIQQSFFNNLHTIPFIVDQKPEQKIERRRKACSIDLNLLQNLKIDDILRSLTSKIYKHQKSQNYEEFEFIGDVVLKFLATIQIFLQKAEAQEGQMHIGRANLICNANLHRAGIRMKMFLYAFTTKKKSQPAPIIKVYKNSNQKDDKQKYSKTQINILGANDDEQGYQYIPGKVHADMMESLIGAFYLKNKRLCDCQTLLYAFQILKKPTLKIDFLNNDLKDIELPGYLIELEQRLRYNFRHKGLLIQALTHPSFLEYIQDAIDDQSFSRLISDVSKLNESNISNNLSTDNIIKINKHEAFYQRLQFLGDAFLDMLVVQYLYDKGGEYLNDEGTLSFLKQSAVSNKTLGFIALKLNLFNFIFMNIDDIDSTIKQFRFISKSMKDAMPSPVQFAKLKIGSLKILGDVFESLIGAIFIDNEFSYEDTKMIVMQMIEPYIRHFTDMSFIEQSPNYKFKEYLDQNNYKQVKVVKSFEESVVAGEYMYKFTDKAGNVIGESVSATNEKDAWDKFFDSQKK